MKTAAIYLPFFCGFYESWMEPSDEYIQARAEENFLNEDEDPNRDRERLDEAFERVDIWDYFDNKQYMEEMGKHFTNVLNEKMWNGINRKIPFLNGVKYIYESIQNPKYYSFEADKINGYVKLEDNSYIDLMTYLAIHNEEFDQYLRENYSNRDGFVSFVKNNYNDFMNEMTCEDSDQRDKDRDLSIALEFVLERYFKQEYNWEDAEVIMRELAQTTQEDLTEYDFFDYESWADDVRNEYNRLRLGL